MQPIAGSAPNARFWRMTLVGSPADRKEQPTPCPASRWAGAARQPVPLTMMTGGDRAWVVHINGGPSLVRRLTDLGIVQGSEITVINRSDNGSVVVGLSGCRLGVGAGMAHCVMVAAHPPEEAVSGLQEPAPVTSPAVMPTFHLGMMAVGQAGRIVGYEPGDRAYRGKLLAMGLTPGTPFTVTRQAPMGGPH